jgi:hypothetical protein
MYMLHIGIIARPLFLRSITCLLQGDGKMTDQLSSFSEIAQIIEQQMLPNSCHCVLSNDISVDITVTTDSKPPKTFVVPGVYLPSLKSQLAIQKLVDELRCGVIAADEVNLG